MIIRIPLRFEGSKGEKNLNAEFRNTGTYSLIAAECLENVGQPIRLRSPLKIAVLDNKDISSTHVTVLDFYIENIRLSDEFLVVDGLDSEVVIGNGTVRKWGLNLDFRNGSLSVDHRSKNPILVNLY